jgi:hypothetical protein
MVYNLVRESTQLKFEIDLRYSHLSLLTSDNLFRIRYGLETLFCQGLNLLDHEAWFK